MDSIEYTANNAENDAWSAVSTRVYQTIAGERFDRSDPTTFIGFVNVTDIDHIEMGGTDCDCSE